MPSIPNQDQQTKPKVFKKLYFYLIMVLIILAGLEAGTYLLNEIHQVIKDSRNSNSHPKPEDIQRQELSEEVKFLYYGDKCIYHPYRWYTLPPHYRGKHITLDEYGFRNNPDQIKAETIKIACFGGSTMFSTMTDDSGAIPFLLNGFLPNDRVQALNYGLGGYSSTVEMTTLIEMTRLVKNIKYAIFYDGVNEVGRYFEYLQLKDKEKFYHVMGYPFMFTMDFALMNFIVSKQIMPPEQHKYKIHSQFISTLRDIIKQKSKSQVQEHTQFKSAIDYNQSAKVIADIYINNMIDISSICKGKGITPIFLLQPNIYCTTKKKFTTQEKEILSTDYANVDIKKFYNLSYQTITSDPRLKNLNFHDLSGILNQLDDKNYFEDYCHVNKDANRLIAGEIFTLLKKYLPSEYYQ